MNNYNTSRDYELLWELASKGKKIICEVDFEFDDNNIVRDICRISTYPSSIDGDITQISSRGITYIYAHDKADFIKQCQKLNLEFILPNTWISAKDRLPEKEKPVLVAYKNDWDKDRIVRAFYLPKHSIKAEDFYHDTFDFPGEYFEDEDEYYAEEGFYEFNENEEVHYRIYEKITHWQPLPEPPKGE